MWFIYHVFSFCICVKLVTFGNIASWTTCLCMYCDVFSSSSIKLHGANLRWHLLPKCVCIRRCFVRQWTYWRRDIETPVTTWLPPQKANSAALRCFICCYFQQSVEQAVDAPVISYVLSPFGLTATTWTKWTHIVQTWSLMYSLMWSWKTVEQTIDLPVLLDTMIPILR